MRKHSLAMGFLIAAMAVAVDSRADTASDFIANLAHLKEKRICPPNAVYPPVYVNKYCGPDFITTMGWDAGMQCWREVNSLNAAINAYNQLVRSCHRDKPAETQKPLERQSAPVQQGGDNDLGKRTSEWQARLAETAGKNDEILAEQRRQLDAMMLKVEQLFASTEEARKPKPVQPARPPQSSAPSISQQIPACAGRMASARQSYNACIETCNSNSCRESACVKSCADGARAYHGSACRPTPCRS